MRLKRLLSIALVATLAGACGSPSTTGGGKPHVVGSFYPLYEAVARVGGDRVEARNLTPAGAEPHDIELNTDDLAALQSAELVVYLGSGFQPAVERALSNRSATSLDAAAGVDLLPGAGDEHDEGEEVDPHVWLDPLQMKRVVEAVAARLSALDADGAATFRTNAAAYLAELDALHTELANGLRPCRSRTFVTSHAAFGYLAARYDLQQEPIAGISPESEPNPRRLAGLRALVQREKITTIFTETLASPRVGETLAREAGVKTAVLNPIEGLTDEQQRAGETYITQMRANLRALIQALDCGE